MFQTRHAFLMVFALLALVFSASCSSKSTPGTAPSASASATSTTSAELRTSPAPERGGDDVKPVYPQTKDPPDPVAEHYCELIYEVAEKKRKECCPSMPFTGFRPTGECVRTLSYALHSKAVSIEQADLDKCETAILQEAKQCDWGGSMPAVCEGIIHGHIEANTLCRSSLECKDGLYCAGLGASTPGKCRPSLPDGIPCGGGTDTLGAFVRQDAERQHPQCQGYCASRLCAKTTAVGEACLSSIQCGQDRSCIAGKCSNAPLPSSGEPCVQKVCASGLACVQGKCVTPRRIDEDCKVDDECRSRYCEGADKGQGKCQMNCQIIRSKSTATGAPSAPAASSKP